MKPKLTLLLLFALFFAPMLIAVALHSEWVDWQPSPDRSHGQLLDPVVELQPFTLQTALGEPLGLQDLAGRWQMAYMQPGPCEADCLDRLQLLRQIRVSQDRHRPDIGLVYATDAQVPETLARQIVSLDASFAAFGGDAGRQLLAQFPGADAGGFYIVDPSGNIIERFGIDADPNGIRKDLRRLLTWTVRE